MARCKHYDKAFDCCVKLSELVEDVIWLNSCYYKDDVCPDCRYFEEAEDVVPVVRCCNCIHLKTNISKENYCDFHSTYWDKFYVRLDDFCGYGERR